MTTSREIRLKSRPVGLPGADNFELATVELAAPGPGEVQVRNSWMTVDPYMRGRMNDVKSYTPPFALGEVLQGGAVGQVTASNDPALKVGDPWAKDTDVGPMISAKEAKRAEAWVAEAVAAYARRYRPPKQRTDRVVILIEVDRVMCSSGLR